MNIPHWLAQATGANQFAMNPNNGFDPTMGDAMQGIGHSMMEHYRRNSGMQPNQPGMTPAMPGPTPGAPPASQAPPQEAPSVAPQGGFNPLMGLLGSMGGGGGMGIGSLLGLLGKSGLSPLGMLGNAAGLGGGGGMPAPLAASRGPVAPVEFRPADAVNLPSLTVGQAAHLFR